MSNRRYILMNASAGLVLRIAGAGLALGSQILIARVIGKEHFGTYLYAMSSIALLAIGARLGIDSALPRFLPVMLAKERFAAFRGTLRFAFALPFVLSVGLALATLFYLYVLRQSPRSPYQTTLVLMLCALPAFTLSFIRQAAMISLKRVVGAELPDMIIRPTLMIVGTLTLFFTLREVGPEHIAALFAVAASAALAAGGVMLWRARPVEARGHTASYPVGEVMRVAMPLLLMTGFSNAVAEFTVVCLGWYQPTDEVAVYGAAVRLSLLVAFALQAANMVLNPLISRLYHTGQYAELQASLTFAARWMFLLTCCALVGMVVLGKIGLALFGDGYEMGYPVLLILLAGQAINALSGSVGSIMKMCNKQNQACAILVFSAVTTVALCFTLIPSYGAVGAAVSVAAGQILWNMLMLGYTVLHLRLNPTVVPMPITPVPDDPHPSPLTTPDQDPEA